MTTAERRADFIKRLFAVAISIGVTTSFINMKWVTNGLWLSQLDLQDWERIVILVTGMFVTVLSWDGYLASIETKLLNDGPRFAIDIILVFVYLFFLMPSVTPYVRLPTLAVVFVLYVVWDVLTVRRYIARYDASLKPAGADDNYIAKFRDVPRVYGRGFLDRPDTDRGPIVSLSWAIFFFVLAILDYAFRAPYQVFVMCAFVCVGLGFYRDEKRTIPGAQVRGYRMFIRALLIVLLLSLVGLYFCRFGSNPSA